MISVTVALLMKNLMISHGTSRIYSYFKIYILLRVYLRTLKGMERMDSVIFTCNPVEQLLYHSIYPSLHIHETTRKQLNEFSQNLILGNFTNIC
jgi:predicted membrane channel-forming protein YqfA (hemolysin III family)